MPGCPTARLLLHHKLYYSTATSFHLPTRPMYRCSQHPIRPLIRKFASKDPRWAQTNQGSLWRAKYIVPLMYLCSVLGVVTAICTTCKALCKVLIYYAYPPVHYNSLPLITSTDKSLRE